MSEKTPGLQMVRQPIFDDTLKVVAYNLLYKDDEQTASHLFGNTNLAVQLILDEYTSVYESGEVKELPAYISVPEESVRVGWQPTFDPEHVILDLRGPVGSSSGYIAAVHELVEAGFKISLGGFGAHSEINQLLDIVHTIKLNVNKMEGCRLKKNLSVLRRHDICVLASEIKSAESLEACFEMGFDYYQGNFLTKPKRINEGKLGPNQAAVLQLISELQNPDATPKSLEEIVQLDPVLTFKLLKIVNSATYSLVREVTSIADTIVMLGIDQVKQLAMIVGMTGQSDKPLEMYRSLLTRGHMCEYIAREAGYENQSSYFLAGVMSGLHLLFDTSIEHLLDQIAVVKEIRCAIMEHEGRIGQVLGNAINYQEGAWDQLTDGIDIELYEDAYLSGMRWVNDVMASTH